MIKLHGILVRNIMTMIFYNRYSHNSFFPPYDDPAKWLAKVTSNKIKYINTAYKNINIFILKQKPHKGS